MKTQIPDASTRESGVMSAARAIALLATAMLVILMLAACNASTASRSDSHTSTSSASQASAQQDMQSEGAKVTAKSIRITTNATTWIAQLADNSSAQAFADLLAQGPITLHLHDYGNFEKVGELETALPTNDEQITTTPGDIILYQGDKITIYYNKNSWNFTRLAHIDGLSTDDMLAVLGSGDVDARFELERS